MIPEPVTAAWGANPQPFCEQPRPGPRSTIRPAVALPPNNPSCGSDPRIWAWPRVDHRHARHRRHQRPRGSPSGDGWGGCLTLP